MRTLSVTFIALVFAGIAGAADEAASKPAESGTQAAQEAAPVGTPVYTSGKVTSMHSVPLVGIETPHIVVKLQTEQGDTEIVDLGSVAELKRNGIDPKEGQQLWVDGQVGQINGKFLIVAEVLSENKMMFIKQETPLSEESVKHANAGKDGHDVNAVSSKSAPETKNAREPHAAKTETVNAGASAGERTVTGTVIHTLHVKIEGEADEHVLAKLQTPTGIAVVDLGTCPAMPNTVSLQEGQTVVTTGSVGELNGKPIIVANSVGNTSSAQSPIVHEALPATSK
jgi:hypothetical protein